MARSERSGGSFLRELRRRKVMRTCIAYLVVCWVLLQMGEIMFPAVGLDGDQGARILMLLAIVGFPVTFAFAWYFQITPRGIVRTTSFVERRILRNIPPINDQRHERGGLFQKGDTPQNYHWIIAAETGPLTGLRFGIAQTVELGRSLDCDIALVSPQVSRHHARLELEDDRLVVEDLGSSNGTVVNGKLIHGRHYLCNEDELRLHDIIFRVTEVDDGRRRERDSLNQTTFLDVGLVTSSGLTSASEPDGEQSR